MLARHVESKSNKATINFSSTTKIFLAENPKQEKTLCFFQKKNIFFFELLPAKHKMQFWRSCRIFPGEKL